MARGMPEGRYRGKKTRKIKVQEFRQTLRVAAMSVMSLPPIFARTKLFQLIYLARECLQPIR